jgi:endonuclease YncB( thermonuclease family)
MRLLLVAALLVLAPGSYAGLLTGTVVRIVDGDTITVLDASKTQHRVRLAGIDAPELGQSYGKTSRQHLALLVGGKSVTVDWQKRDRYGRIVGKVLQDSADAGLAQIRAGVAWHFKKYEFEQSPEDRLAYAEAEAQARAGRVGLWRDKGAIPPWEWRYRER